VDPAAGLTALAYASGVTVALMVAIYVCSHLLLRYGLVPLSAAFSFSGFNVPLFYLLILPGTVVHELSHVLACLMTGVHVRDVRLFSPQANGVVGWVTHDTADPLRRGFIALAPFLGGSVAIYALIRFVLPPTEVDPLTSQPVDLALGFKAAAATIVGIVRSSNLHEPKTWFGLYLLFSLGYAVAPSRQDLHHLVAGGLMVIGLIMSVIVIDGWFQLRLMQNGLINNAAANVAVALQHLNALLMLACAGIALGTAVIVPVAVLSYWLRRSLAAR